MSLMPRHIIGELDLTDYPFAVIRGSSDYGMPTNVAEIIDSMLQDGEIVSSTRTSNRVMSHSVFIEEADMQALAEAEARLIAECDKQRNTWSIDPGDGYGAVTVFDIFRVQVAYVHDDNWEWAGYRRYDLTIPALPFGRAEIETVVDALTSGGTPTTVAIADGTSATGWGSPDGAVTSVGGQLIVPKRSATFWTQTDSFGNFLRGYKYEANLAQSAVDYSATPYLTLEVDVTDRTSQFQIPIPKVYADGAECRLVANDTLAPPDPAWVAAPRRCTYLVEDASVSEIKIVGETYTANSTSGSVAVDNVSRSNVAPAITSRMSLRTITVGGSARTQASLLVRHDSAALGLTAVYTSPNLSVASGGVAIGGYSPPLDRYRTTVGTGTADTSTLSGTRKDAALSSDRAEFAVPAARLPEGGYLLFLRARSKSGTITPTLGWTAATEVGSTTLGEQSGTTEPLTLASGASGWQLIPVGGMVLPPTSVGASSIANVTIAITTESGSTGWEWDEALLFYMGEDSALTIVDAGTGSLTRGSSHNSLWIESPTLDNPAPRVLLGLNGDGSTGFHAGEKAQAWGVHQFRPGEMSIFAATTNATNPEVSLRYHRRFHTHATAEEA